MVVDQVTKVTPPEELSPRIISRDAPRRSQADEVRSAIHASVIRWRDLVLAAWQLSDDEQYTGRLPEGMSSQQFWAKVTRAAKAMHGTVGIVTRGRQWWVWSARRGQHRVPPAKPKLWDSLWKEIDNHGSGRIQGRLNFKNIHSLHASARRRGVRLKTKYVIAGDYTEVRKHGHGRE